VGIECIIDKISREHGREVDLKNISTNKEALNEKRVEEIPTQQGNLEEVVRSTTFAGCWRISGYSLYMRLVQ
jgi:hypothetical protein